MKTPSSQLFYLIKKMSAAEKRFLKIHFSSVKSHLTELFDFINSQDTYDEKIVKANFSNSLISKNLKVYKVQLTELILRSQVAYHAKRTVRSQIRILLEEVDILISQFLVPVAMVRLHKAIAICKENNETALLVVALQYQFMLERYISRQKVNTPFNGDGNALNEALQTLMLETELIQLVRLLDTSCIMENGSERSTVIAAIDKIPNRDAIRAGNNASAFYLGKLQALTTENLHDRISQQERIIERFQTDQYKFINQRYLYLETLSDLMDSYVLVTNKDKVEAVISLIGKLFEEENYNAKFLYLPAYIEAKHNFYHGITEHRLSSFGHISGLDPELQIEIDNVFALGFHFFEILYNMTTGQNEKVKGLLSVLQSATKPGHHHENILLDLIEIIDHYDCDNIRTVNYLLSSFQRKLKRGKTFTPFTIATYDFVKNIIKTPHDKKTLTEQFILASSKIENDAVQKLWKQFHLNDWLDCLLHDIKFSELTARKSMMSRPDFSRQLSKDLSVLTRK